MTPTRRPVILVPYPKPDYVDALTEAGAEVKTVEAPVAGDALAGVDGVLLTGGRDIDPARYGDERHPATEDSEPGRDDLEIDLARRAIARDIPLLAICRGLQVLNVAAGGTLVQDIPTGIGHMVPHDVREPKDADAHPVRITPDSRLGEVLRDEIDEHGETVVNSRHHQAIGRVAPGLDVSAVAPDGLPEAVEKPGARFCVGVQWHPENFRASKRFSGLFDAFVRSTQRGATS